MNPLLGRAFNDELEKLSRATVVSLPSSRLSSTEEGGVFGSGTRTKKEDLGSIGTKQEGKLPVFDDIKPKKAPKPAKAPRPRQPGPSPKVKIEHPGTAKLKARIEGERKHHAALGNLSSKSLATYHRVKDPRLQAQAKAIQTAGGNPQSLLTAGQNPIFPRPIGAPAPKPVAAPPRPTYTGGKVTMNSPATRAAASN